MRSDLQKILDPILDNNIVDNDLDGGAVVIDSSLDTNTISHIVKARRVVIPWVEHDELAHDGLANDFVEALLWSASEIRDKAYVNRAKVIEELQRQLGSKVKLTRLFAGGGSRALEVAHGLDLEVLEGFEEVGPMPARQEFDAKEGDWPLGPRRGNLILGLGETVGYYANRLDELEGWLVFPSQVAVVEVL
jgi:hypothetical protein